MKKYMVIKTITAYVLLFFTTVLIIQQIWFQESFDTINFINWDAGHYHFIKNNGYEGHRVAFFPLFPLIWKFLSLDRYGISILNTVIFLFSFYLLVRELKIKSIQEILLYLSIPSCIFFYVPYSESLFFLTSTLILIGLKNNKDFLIYIGLFFAILSRPAFTIFIPALLITEILSARRDGIHRRIGSYAFITTIGILLVSYIQYIDTGEWFQFFSAQKNWNNELQVPTLPFTSWGSGFAFGIDSLAFLIGTISGGFILSLFLKVKSLKNISVSKDVIFACSYLGGITLLVLLFRGGSLFSLNRFVFATPFIIVAFNYWMKQSIHLNYKKLLLIPGFVCIFWLLFGSYTDIEQFLKFILLAFYALLFFAVKSDKTIIKTYSLLLFIFLNFSFQVISYVGFLSGKWIG